MRTASNARIAAERVTFLTEGRSRGASVRAPILASWRRSVEQHVDAERVQPPYVAELDLEQPLCRAAAPALEALREAVHDLAVSIVLTDAHGLVLGRLTSGEELERRLDRAMLAPGFAYSEGDVGTNGIGTALEVGGPAAVLGAEHYAENLEDLACAAVPITHPVTGRVVGVVNLTTWQRDAGPLLVPLARTTAQQVGATVLDLADAPQRALFREYLRLEHRTAGIVVAVGSDVTMLSDRARAQLGDAERSAVVAVAEAALAQSRPGSVEVTLPGEDGADRVLRVRSRLVGWGGHDVGVVATVSRLDRPCPVAAREPDRPAGDGGRRLSPLEAMECEAIERALREHGGDRSAAAAALGMSRATIYRRIRSYRIVEV